MSWGGIFFGFRGRVNRRTYWFAGVVVVGIASLIFNALLAYLATGNPIAFELLERPADKIGIWAPVWIAYFAFLAWPATAIAVKRLHDRGRPAWIWYVFYALSFIFALVPLKSTVGAETSPAQLLQIPLTIFSVYIVFELGVLRGTAGPNEHGADTLPPGYYGGDYSFWSWMLAVEGRISRSKWWLGIFILTGIVIAVSIVVGLLVYPFIAQHPEFQQNLSNPEWMNSNEAAPLLLKLLLRLAIPLLILDIAIWSLVALGVKRLHDRALSSWLILLVLIPIFGAIWSVVQFGILKGKTGPNKYGPDPLTYLPWP
jgi:uncharacterized membrane protein YhaH (DUF805 family)